MIRWCLMITACFFVLPSFSQENSILEGVVIADSLGNSAINIINITQQTGTTNSDAGNFEIEVKENDTLVFSSVQYETVEVIITPGILNERFLEVYLGENVNELEEVQISNSILTGNLSQDISQMETFKQRDLGFPFSSRTPLTPVERKLNTARGGEAITLLNTLNGTIKMLKKAKENESLSMLVDKGIEAFPKVFFVEDLDIPAAQIRNFVYFCAESPRFKILLEGNDPFKLLEYYQEQAKMFLAEEY